MSSSYALLQDILLRFLSAGMHGENVAVVVALDDESLQSNTQDSALEDFSKASRSRVVVKVRSPAIAPLLVASNSNNSLVLDDEFELPIIGSLLSTPPAVASRSAVVLRDQTALLVYSNHVEDVVQYVVDIDRRLHHSSHFYSRRAPMPLPGDAISCQPPDIQEGFIFAPQDYLTEDAWLDDPVLGLPEIDVPLNAVPPFESEGRSEYKDSAFPLPQIRLDDSASLGASLTGVYESLLSGIAPPSLNPFWVNNASTDTEYTTTYSDTTISPSLLYLPVYTPDYATLSPSSTLNATSPTMLSDARTPSPFDVYTPSTSTLEDLSVSPEVKLDTEQSPIDQWHLSSSSLSLPEPPSWSPSSASSTALPRTIPQETPAVTLSDSKHNATSVALGKRKRGSSHIPMFAAGVSDTTTSRLQEPLPKRRAVGEVPQASRPMGLHPLPGRPVHPSQRRALVQPQRCEADHGHGYPCREESPNYYDADADGEDDPDADHEGVEDDDGHRMEVDGGGSNDEYVDDDDAAESDKGGEYAASDEEYVENARSSPHPAKKRRTSSNSQSDQGEHYLCKKCGRTFIRGTDWRRHQDFSTCANGKRKLWPCTYNGCDTELSRKDALLRHMRIVHNASKQEGQGQTSGRSKGGSSRQRRRSAS